MRWKLRDFLDRHNVNPHQLVLATGLSTRTIYPMAAGESTRVDLHSLDVIIVALRDLTGEQVDITDLLEFADAKAEPDLHAWVRNAGRSASVLEGTGGKPGGSNVTSARSVADAVVEERNERERGA